MTCSKTLSLNPCWNWPNYYYLVVTINKKMKNCPCLNLRAVDRELGETYTEFQTRVAIQWKGQHAGLRGQVWVLAQLQPKQYNPGSLSSPWLQSPMFQLPNLENKESLIYVYKSCCEKQKPRQHLGSYQYRRHGATQLLTKQSLPRAWVWISIWDEEPLGALPTLSFSHFPYS